MCYSDQDNFDRSMKSTFVAWSFQGTHLDRLIWRFIKLFITWWYTCIVRVYDHAPFYHTCFLLVPQIVHFNLGRKIDGSAGHLHDCTCIGDHLFHCNLHSVMCTVCRHVASLSQGTLLSDALMHIVISLCCLEMRNVDELRGFEYKLHRSRIAAIFE